MGNESIPNCIVHKDTRNIQVRLDYMFLFRNETKAKVIRIMETWTDQKRAEWFKLQKDKKETHVEEPPEEALWITMSYDEFSIYAYGTINHDTIKQHVDELVTHEYMKRRPHPMPGYAPQYLLDTKLLQETLNDQVLPNLFEDIGKIRPPRKKHTPLEKYPQGEGINHRGDMVKIPPQGGEISPPSKNTTKNHRESTKNRGEVATSDEDRNAPIPINLEVKREEKRETNPRLPVLTVKPKEQTASTRVDAATPVQHSGASPGLLPPTGAGAAQGGKRASKHVAQDIPLEAVRIMDDWDSLFKRPSPRTDNHIKAAVSLIASNPTKDDLDNVRKFCFSSNPEWYRNKGVTLIDVSRNFGKWQSLQEVEPIPIDTQSKDKNIGVSGLPRLKPPGSHERKQVNYG